MLPVGRPALMGILNVTPDSFSDGGQFESTASAVDHALRMVDEGADLIDVGGESTRPGASAVSLSDELRRVMPVVEALASRGIVVSVDTSKSEVARAALAAGAQVVNDVTAFRDSLMASVCASAGCMVCLMHMQGEPRTMQATPQYGDVVEEVRSFLLSAARGAEAAGIARDRIWIDPGIGFGKTVAHNLTLLRRLDRFVDTGYPVLLGVSRKSFLGKVGMSEGQILPVGERLPATLAAQVIGQLAGVRIIRAHDVAEARRAIDLVSAIRAHNGA